MWISRCRLLRRLQLVNVAGIRHESLTGLFPSREDSAGPVATEVQVDDQYVVIWALALGQGGMDGNGWEWDPRYPMVNGPPRNPKCA